MGASAGTHIATSNIKHVEFFDKNNVKTSDYAGLNLYEGIMICHYNDDRKQILEKLNEKDIYKVEKLADNEVLYNKNKEWFKI